MSPLVTGAPIGRAGAPARDGGGRSAEAAAGLTVVARGAVWNLFGAAVSGAATLAVTIVIARSFGREVAGTFFAATSLMLLAEAIGNLGAYNGVIYFVARLRSFGEDAAIPPVLRRALGPVIVLSVALALVLLVLAGPAAAALVDGRVSGAAERVAVAHMLRVLCLAIPFAAVSDTVLGAARGYRDMRPTVFVDRIGRSALQFAGVLIAALAGSAGLLAPLWALPYVLAAVCGWWWLRRIQRREDGARAPGLTRSADGAVPAPTALPSSPPATAPPATAPPATAPPATAPASDTGAVGFWRFTAPRSVASAAQMAIQRLDIVLVAIMRGPVAAAVYTAATRFLVLGQLGNTAITMSAQPQFTHLFARGDRSGANDAYQATTAWLILLTWPIYLLVILYGPQVLAVFGHSYRTGATVTVILAFAMLLATACGQVDTVLITAGRSTWSLGNGLLALGVNVGLDLALIPRLGITGAAIGWAAAIAASNLVPLAQVAAVLRVHPFGRASLAAVLVSLVSFAAIPLAFRYAAGTGGVAAVLGVGTGGVVMAAAVWRLRDVVGLSVARSMPRAGGAGRFGGRGE